MEFGTIHPHHGRWKELLRKHYPGATEADLDAHAHEFCKTHPEYQYVQQVARKMTFVKTDRFVLWVIAALLLVLLTTSLAHCQSAPSRQSGIPVFFISSQGTRVYTVAAPFTLDFGSNAAVTVTGNKVSVQPTGGGGAWPGYPTGTGIVNVVSGTSWGSVYNASNTIPANYIPALSYVTSVALTAPSWLSVAGSPITSSGTLAVTAAGAQTTHQVIGTCGTATSFAPCSLVAGDIPALPYLSNSTVLPATLASVAHKFFTSYTSTTGLYTAAQPVCGDLSDSGTLCTSSAALAANTTATAHNFFSAYNSTTGAFTKAQPACADLSDSASGCSTAAYTLPTASTSVLGGVKVDGSTITIAAGVISAATGGSGTVVDGAGTTTAGQLAESTTTAHTLQYVTANASAVGLGSVTNDVQTKNSIVPNSFAGVRFGNSGAVDTAATSAQVQTVIGAGVYDASGAAAARAATETCTNQVLKSVSTAGTSDCTTVTTAMIGTLASGSNGLAASATTDTTNAANISSGTIPDARLASKYRTVTCQPGLGDGLNAMAAGTYLMTECLNETGATMTITAIKCFTDNSGSSTLNVTNSAGTGLLTGAVTCTSSFASGTQSATTTLASGDYAKFTFVADGTSKQTTFVVTGTI